MPVPRRCHGSAYARPWVPNVRGMGRTTDPLRRLSAGQWQSPATSVFTEAATVTDRADAGPVAEAWARHAAPPGRDRASPGDGVPPDDASPGPGPGRLSTALTVPLPLVVGAVAVVVGAGGWWLWQQVMTDPTPATVLGAPVVVGATGAAPTVAGTAPAAAAGGVPADSAPAGGAVGAGAAASPLSSATVHVAGAVDAPGIVVVAPGARVVDAVAAAGGLSEAADVAGVNLARPVTDGEMIVVPTPGQLVPAQAGAVTPGSGGPAGQGPVNVNRASAAELEELPGIGPVLAERIVQWREDAGPFTSVDDMTAVPGIGPSVLEGLRDAATV